MSLEECKWRAEENREKKKEIQKTLRQSRGVRDGEDVRVYLSRSPFRWPRDRWIVFVSAYGEISSKYFSRQVPAERYFEDLTKKYCLEEEKHEPG